MDVEAVIGHGDQEVGVIRGLVRRAAISAMVVLLGACTGVLQPPSPVPSAEELCGGGAGCWEPAPSGVLVVPTCDDNGACGEGFALNDRFYSLLCLGVDPAVVTDGVEGIGDEVYAEARVIRGLPSKLWLAVRGELPCLPAAGEPLEHEWYLSEYADVSPSERQEYGSTVSEVLVRP